MNKRDSYLLVNLLLFLFCVVIYSMPGILLRKLVFKQGLHWLGAAAFAFFIIFLSIIIQIAYPLIPQNAGILAGIISFYDLKKGKPKTGSFIYCQSCQAFNNPQSLYCENCGSQFPIK